MDGDGDLRLEIADNGRGFKRARPTAGFGIVGMRERARPARLAAAARLVDAVRAVHRRHCRSDA